MNTIDKALCEIIQRDGKISITALAESVGIPTSTANDRLRRLENTGVIQAWRGVLNPLLAGANLCAFLFIDVQYQGEQQVIDHLKARKEVQELHHISGPRSYLLKIRVADIYALQAFIQQVLKPLEAVIRTESFITLETLKETTEIKI